MLEWVDGVYLFSYSLPRVLAFIQFFFLVVGKARITLTQNVMAFH